MQKLYDKKWMPTKYQLNQQQIMLSVPRISQNKCSRRNMIYKVSQLKELQKPRNKTFLMLKLFKIHWFCCAKVRGIHSSLANLRMKFSTFFSLSVFPFSIVGGHWAIEKLKNNICLNIKPHHG